MVSIYILKLEKNKYYIGKTENVEFRIGQHKTGTASAWTKKYPLLDVIEVHNNCDAYDEDKYTLKYMNLFGVNNVRGGTFASVTLDRPTRETITKMLNGSADRCYKCGEQGHFANECEDVYECAYCDREYKTERGLLQHEEKCRQTAQHCYRCKRPGHYSNNCYAKTDINGHRL